MRRVLSGLGRLADNELLQDFAALFATAAFIAGAGFVLLALAGGAVQ